MSPLRDGVPQGFGNGASHRPSVSSVRACVEEQGEDPAQEMSGLQVRQVEHPGPRESGMSQVRTPLDTPRGRCPGQLSQMQVRVLEG